MDFFLAQIKKLYKREKLYASNPNFYTPERIREARNDEYTNGIVNSMHVKLLELIAKGEDYFPDKVWRALNYFYNFWDQVFAYRNDGEYSISLISAFSLGLGIYNKKVLQRLQSNQQWEALGFEVKKGKSKTGDEMIVCRPDVNTPSYSNKTFTEKSLQIYRFGSFDDECKAIAKMIEHYIKEEQVLPNDICVICIDQKYVGSYLETIATLLRGLKILPYLLLDSKTTEFFQEGMVTLSTVNKAKGNECGVVIICGADSVFKSPNNVVMRDKLFTSMTRTKGWLTLTGCSEHMLSLEKEYQALKDHNFELHFIQPAEEDTKNIENVSKAESKFEENFYNQLAKLRHSGIDEKEIRKLLENIMRSLDSGKS